MLCRILKTFDGSPNGSITLRYEAGTVRDLPASLAEVEIPLGNAEPVDTPAAENDAEGWPVQPPAETLIAGLKEKYSVKQLRAMCKKRGISLHANSREDEIAALLAAAMQAEG